MPEQPPNADSQSPSDESGVVARIVYASQATIHESIYSEMEGIRQSALKHNEPIGVYTALLYQSGWFVQWKEGPGDSLLRLMDRVACDRRHHSMRIVHSSRGPRLLSAPWSMAIVKCDDTEEEMSERVSRLRQSMIAGVQFSPSAIWRQISTPMRHPGAARQSDPDAFQRVMVCAAVGSASFDLVRWLAHRNRQEVVHRRFAGAHDLDVGTDLVDFMDDDRVMRVIAMARNGLALALTRAFMSDYSHLVLLLSGHVQSDLALVHRVAEACARMTRPPILVGVAEHAASHVEPFAAARKARLIYLQCNADPEHCSSAWAAAHPLLETSNEAANNSGYPVEALRMR
jgi:hypothetical protein